MRSGKLNPAQKFGTGKRHFQSYRLFAPVDVKAMILAMDSRSGSRSIATSLISLGGRYRSSSSGQLLSI